MTSRILWTALLGRTRTVLPEPLQRLDEAGYRALARRHSPMLDAVLPRLTRAANHGTLWYGVAAGLLSTRDPRARRAARRGLTALALTAALVNVPVKLLFRRGRPELAGVPLPRRLARAPLTSSFPSGHTASAFAFATAASMEMPALGAPLGGVAAAIGMSRVYVGAHFPSDVVAGAVIGAGVAVASRRLWKDAVNPPRSRKHVGAIGGLTDGKGMAVVLNTASGPAIGRDVRHAVDQAFPDAEMFDADEDVLVSARAASETEPVVLAVCGGDGTVNAAAQVAVERELPLLVIPGGTLNHFARDIPIDSVADAKEAAEHGRVITADVASIDDRIFLNTASFGIYPDMVDERERLARRIGKWPAGLVALARALRRAEPLLVELDGRRRRIWALFAGNCRYEPRGFAPSSRASLSDGTLDIRVLRAEGRFTRLRLLAAMLTGDLARSIRYEEWTSDRLEVRSLSGPLRLAHDGETFDGSDRFVIAKRAKALTVLVPPSPQDRIDAS